MLQIVEKLTYFWKTYFENARVARKDGGVLTLRQLWELIELRFRGGKLLAADYYYFRAYRSDLKAEEKRKFFSNYAIPRRLGGRKWSILGQDKLLTYALLEHQGLPIPEIRATCHTNRCYREKPALCGDTSIAAFFQNTKMYPLVVKPISGSFGRNVHVVLGTEIDNGNVWLKNDKVLSISDFSRDLAAADDGYIIQELLHPHPTIAQVCGENLCSIRFLVLCEGSSVKIHRAVLKIAVEPNTVDNYWRKGNLLTAIDIEKGQITAACTGLQTDYRSISIHPKTQQNLVGVTLPDWKTTLSVVSRAAQVFPGIPLQAWDVALTSRGPVLLEVNGGSLKILQVVDQRGLYDGEFRELIDRYR